MRLSTVAGLLLTIALLGGCGPAGRPQTLAWLGGREAGQRDAPEDENPFRRTLAHQQTTTAAADELTAARSAGARSADGAAGSSRRSSALDAETQALVDRELADATPEERRELLAEFENVDPSMIRQLLRIRRMVRQVGHHAAAASAEPGLVDPRNAGISGVAGAAAPAGSTVGYSHGAAERTVTRTDGLGDVSPWQHAHAAEPPAPEIIMSVAGGAPRPGAVPIPPGHPAHGHRPTIDYAQGVHTPAAPVQLLPAETEPQPIRPAGSALARMVPRLDTFPSLFPMGGSDAPPGPAEAGPPPPPSVSRAGISTDPAPSDGVWQDDIEQLIARLEAEMSQVPPPSEPDDPAAWPWLEAQVYLRMLYLIAGRQEQAIAHVPGVAPAVQQFWQQLLWSMANAFDAEHIPDPAERAAQTLLQLQAAAGHLREQAPLRLDNVAFCTKITSFGNYDRFDPYEFSPGQPVLLYAEVENFRSEPTTDQHGQNAFRTVLQSRVEILSPAGDVHFQMDFPPTEDLCRARRRDYFHSYEFTIPPRMPYGHHVLLLTVEDRVSRKLATYRLNFTVK